MAPFASKASCVSSATQRFKDLDCSRVLLLPEAVQPLLEGLSMAKLVPRHKQRWAESYWDFPLCQWIRYLLSAGHPGKLACARMPNSPPSCCRHIADICVLLTASVPKKRFLVTDCSSLICFLSSLCALLIFLFCGWLKLDIHMHLMER